MRNFRLKLFFARIHWRRVLILSLCFALLAGTTHNASAFDPYKVRNKSFEKDKNGDGIPNAWSPSGTLDAKDKRVCNKSKHRKCSFKIVAGGGDENYLTQTARNSSGNEFDTFTYSAWIKGKDLFGAGVSQVYIVFNKTGGGVQFCKDALFAGGTIGWTKFEWSCAAEADFDSIEIYVWTNEDSGKLWFDKVKLSAVAP